MIVLLSSVRFERFPVLVDRHLFGWKRCNQRKGIFGRTVKPNFEIFRRQDHGHSVWMHVAHQFIGLCRNDRGCHQRPFFLSVLAFENPPIPCKYKRRSRVFTFQPKPVIRRRFSPLASQKLVAGTRQRRVFHPYNEIFGASHASARPALGFSQHRTAYTQNSPTLRPVLR